MVIETSSEYEDQVFEPYQGTHGILGVYTYLGMYM
jgi:hypothetical protein